MDIFQGLDWQKLFVPQVPILEVIFRGTVMYLSLFALLRIILKREAGTVRIADLLMFVLLADAAQNGMAGGYETITEGLILVVTIIFWSHSLDWLSYHVPFMEHLVNPKPLMLVKNGRLLRRNMRRELITRDELMAQIREQGIDEISEVKAAYMESDGQISVIKHNGETRGRRQRKGGI